MKDTVLAVLNWALLVVLVVVGVVSCLRAFRRAWLLEQQVPTRVLPYDAFVASLGTSFASASHWAIQTRRAKKALGPFLDHQALTGANGRRDVARARSVVVGATFPDGGALRIHCMVGRRSLEVVTPSAMAEQGRSQLADLLRYRGRWLFPRGVLSVSVQITGWVWFVAFALTARWQDPHTHALRVDFPGWLVVWFILATYALVIFFPLVWFVRRAAGALGVWPTWFASTRRQAALIWVNVAAGVILWAVLKAHSQ